MSSTTMPNEKAGHAQLSARASPPPTPTKRRRWLPRVTVALAVLGIHAWMHYSPLASEKAEPFSVIPDGGAGAMHVSPCWDGFECGYVNVPKDYFNASAGIANIGFARHRAPHQPSKGSIMLNPGGPGGSGVRLLTLGAIKLRAFIGDDYDLIGFDPRGIGFTRPVTKCFPDGLTQQLFAANTMFDQLYTVPNIKNLSDPLNHVALTEQSRQFLAINEAQAMLCHENMDVEDLKYMGTSTVVRDIDFMAQKFDGKGAKINYWGGSYGTILGAYLVNMLPDRIGRSVIDGVADVITWANEPSHRWHAGWTSSAEASYDWFLRECSESGPKYCALAKHVNEDPSTIQDRIEQFLHSLVARPLAAVANGRPGYITSGAARGVLFNSLQRPPTQPVIAIALKEAMGPTRNGTLLLSLMQRTILKPGADGRDLERLGVTCADSPWKPVPTAEDLADELLLGLKTSSKHFGVSPILTEPDGGCQFWPTRGRAPERFTGPWNASLEYPMLIISNTADPITPIASGLLINKHMPNSSTLVVQNGPGHCSIGVPSLCTIKAQRNYWKGIPPKNGTWCEVDIRVFPKFNDTKPTVELLSVEDRQLLDAAADVGKLMAEMRMN